MHVDRYPNFDNVLGVDQDPISGDISGLIEMGAKPFKKVHIVNTLVTAALLAGCAAPAAPPTISTESPAGIVEQVNIPINAEVISLEEIEKIDHREKYDLALLAPALQVPVDKVAVYVEGAKLIIDAAGNVVEVAIPAGTIIALVGGVTSIFGGVADVTEGNYGLDPREVARIRGESWADAVLIQDDVIVTSDRQLIATIKQDTVAGENNPTFNSDQGGQTANPNPDQFKPPEKSPEQEKIDKLLKVDRRRDELVDTFVKVSKAKSSSEELKNPPEFDLVKEFNVAVYDPKSGKVFEGKWSDLHDWIAGKYGLSSEYFSLSVFRLKGSGGINVIYIDNLNGLTLTANDIVAMQTAGYQVLGSGFDWLVLDPSSTEGYTQLTSSLNRWFFR